MSEAEIFELGQTTLQRGLTLPKAHLAYKTYGTLARRQEQRRFSIRPRMAPITPISTG